MRIQRHSCLIAFVVTFSVQALAADLFQASHFRALTSDHRAQKIGDVLTVLIVENSSASATAGTKTDKTTDAGIRLTSPSGQHNYALGIDDSYDGNGKIARTGRLLAQLSVAVVGIEVNGDLRVSGRQLLEINGEKQLINLEGKVRPIDIDQGNTILSNRIADAKITYVGAGALGDSQTKGWLTKLVSSFLGLF